MTTSPSFKITGIHIRGLRGLQELDLPENGLGWKSGFPDIAVIGGANGSGKTTLLRCIAQAARTLVSQPAGVPNEVAAKECRIDFTISDGTADPVFLRFLVGDNDFVENNTSANCFGYVVTGKKPRGLQKGAIAELRRVLRAPGLYAATNWPRLVFLPSDERDLVVPRIKYKAPGQLEDTAGFVAWWERTHEQQWNGSTLELLFSARWADLNAKEEGKAKEAVNFERYTKAFRDLTGGRKRLSWTAKGDLVVELEDNTQHVVKDLSSGERQALLLLAELRRLWRPGSLILIDELELHLHDAWQGQLYEALLGMQQELGGQVIITTQSHSLFEMAESGTQALLGRTGLR